MLEFAYHIIVGSLPAIIPTIVSTGLISIILKLQNDKKFRSFQLKIEIYSALGQELANLVSGTPNFDKLNPLLNGALIFASDDVAAEILKFNKIVTNQRKASTEKFFQLQAEDFLPLMKSIRKDLYLKSEKMSGQEFSFFMKPNN